MSARRGVTRQALHDVMIDTVRDCWWDDTCHYAPEANPWYPVTTDHTREGMDLIRLTAQAGWDIAASQAAARAGLTASEALRLTPTPELIEQWNFLVAFLSPPEPYNDDW